MAHREQTDFVNEPIDTQKGAASMTSINNVLILKASKDLPEHELAAIAAAQTDYRPAVVIGKGGVGAPAYGHVTRLRKIGRALYADLVDVPEAVATAIRNGKLKRVVAEVYHDLNRGGRKFWRALQRIALQGIDAPALNLVPSGVMEFNVGDFESVHSYTTDQHDDPGALVDARVREYMADHPSTSYADAMVKVLELDPNLWATYSGAVEAPGLRSSGSTPQNAGPQYDRYDAGMEIYRLVMREIERNPSLGWTAALKLVLQKHPDLAAAYRGGHSPGFGTSFDSVMGQ